MKEATVLTFTEVNSANWYMDQNDNGGESGLTGGADLELSQLILGLKFTSTRIERGSYYGDPMYPGITNVASCGGVSQSREKYGCRRAFKW